MAIEVGDKVKIRKAKFAYGWNGSGQRNFIGKIGVVVKVGEVTPSKNVPDGKLYSVRFQRYNKQTGKIGVTRSFSIFWLDKLEKPATINHEVETKE